MRLSHRFVFVHSRRDSRWRIELRRRAMNGSRFANSLRFDRISRRIPVNSRAIAQHMRMGLRHSRGARVPRIPITFRVLARGAV